MQQTSEAQNARALHASAPACRYPTEKAEQGRRKRGTMEAKLEASLQSSTDVRQFISNSAARLFPRLVLLLASFHLLQGRVLTCPPCDRRVFVSMIGSAHGRSEEMCRFSNIRLSASQAQGRTGMPRPPGEFSFPSQSRPCQHLCQHAAGRPAACTVTILTRTLSKGRCRGSRHRITRHGRLNAQRA